MIKVKEQTTDELLMIANNITSEYSDKKVRQAKQELYRRGMDDKVIADVTEEKEETFMKRLDAAACAQQAREDIQNEKNRPLSYKWWEMAAMLFFAPFYLLNGLRILRSIVLLLPCHILSLTPVDFSDLFPEFKRLKAEKYDLKFKQRLLLLIAGDMLWLIYGCYQFWRYIHRGIL